MFVTKLFGGYEILMVKIMITMRAFFYEVGSGSDLVAVDSDTCEDFGDYGGDMLYEEEGTPLYDPMDQVTHQSRVSDPDP